MVVVVVVVFIFPFQFFFALHQWEELSAVVHLNFSDSPQRVSGQALFRLGTTDELAKVTQISYLREKKERRMSVSSQPARQGRQPRRASLPSRCSGGKVSEGSP